LPAGARQTSPTGGFRFSSAIGTHDDDDPITISDAKTGCISQTNAFCLIYFRQFT
jgi:hypothetical protein